MSSQEVFDAAKRQIHIDYETKNHAWSTSNQRPFVPGGGSLTEYLLLLAGGPEMTPFSEVQWAELVMLLSHEHYASLRSTLPEAEGPLLDCAMTCVTMDLNHQTLGLVATWIEEHMYTDLRVHIARGDPPEASSEERQER